MYLPGILCASIVCAVSAPHANAARPAWVIPETLNVRSGPGTDRNLICQLTRGTKVHVTSSRDNWSWAKLPDGRWGWIAQWLLEFSAEKGRRLAAGNSGATGVSPASSHPPAWIRPATVNVRSGPGTHYERRGQLNSGARVFILESQQGWSRCRTPGGYGWIQSDLLERNVEAGQRLARGSTTASSVALQRTKAYVDANGVRLRSGPGTTYGVKTSLDRGLTLFATERRGEWVKVEAQGGQDGWVHSSLIKYEDGADGGGTMKGFVSGSRVHLRAGPSLNDRIKARVVEGQTLYITQRQGDWYRARVHGGTDGWIHTSLVKLPGESTATTGTARTATAATSQTSSTSKAYVAGSRVNLRAGPGTNERSRALLLEGQTLYVTGRQSGWYNVTVHGGASGWIHSDYVKLEGADAPQQPATAATPSPSPPPATASTARQVDDLRAWIGEDRVNVRYGPGTDHGIKMKMSRGTEVEVLELTGHWCKIKDRGGNVGWVAGWVMNFKGPGEDTVITAGDQQLRVRTAWVARPVVKVRSGPGTHHSEIGETVLGTEVIILDREGDWYRVVLDNGKTGYMASWLLDTRAQRRARQEVDEPGPPPSTLGAAFVNTARKYLGSRYVRGGSSPSGFDCSGFVSYVLRQHRVNVSRSSSTQFREGTPVSRSQLQPGDIVFFRNTYRAGISHVGIYLGDNQFIHAANRRSGVTITSLSSAYYTPRYAGARRMR